MPIFKEQLSLNSDSQMPFKSINSLHMSAYGNSDEIKEVNDLNSPNAQNKKYFGQIQQNSLNSKVMTNWRF